MSPTSNPARWLGAVGVVLVAYFTLDATLSVRNVERLNEQSQAVAHAHGVVGAVERVLSDLKDGETGQRGYLITGDEQYLQPYSDATVDIARDLAFLEALIGADRPQLASLQDLRGRVRAKLAELDDTIRLRREGGFDAARALVRTNVGKREMDAMRQIGDRMMLRERELLRERQSAADAAAHRTMAQIIISDLIGAVAIVAFLLLMRRHLDARERALAEIAAQRGQLQEADRLKDEFLATLAHELRNPLAPMSNATFILGRGEAAPEARERALATLQRQVRQMVKLIDDLLDVGRIRLGKLALSPRRVQLADIVDQAVETAAPLIEASGHRLHVALPQAPVCLEADPIRLAQVLANLLNNAAKFTPPGGTIALSAAAEGAWVRIAVKDDGAGIDPARLEEVFGLFTQLDRSIERKHSGLGIGLALVRRLTELHGGTVVAHSEGAGRGAEFVVRLPIAPPAGVPAEAPVAAEPAVTRARRVLVVDDNRDGAETLSTIVRLMGHEARTCLDGASALREGDAWRPDLVIMDIGMPGMNGYDVCAAMRATAWGRTALLVALTGWGQEADRLRAESAGFDRHVVKPIGAELLRTLCDDAGSAAPRLPLSA